MAVSLTDKARALIGAPNFATLATINPDGGPQTSVVWVTLDGNDLLFSTVVGRRKERNLRRDPRASVSIFDQQNPYSYLEVRGTVTLVEDGGPELINDLSLKYTGEDYQDDPANVRVVVRLSPERVTGHVA
jgi:PPOX class probable F420-dependent enzyme